MSQTSPADGAIVRGMKAPLALSVAAIALATWSVAHAQTTSEASVPDRLVIRAELLHGINAAKAKPGDKVEMRALAAEKDGERLLIEKDAKLIGHVINAVARTETSPESRIELVIERAEWNGHAIPLNAYIIAQGQIATVRQRERLSDPKCDPSQHLGGGTLDRDTPAYIRCAQDSSQVSGKQGGAPLLRDVELRYVHGRSGSTVLVSSIKNVTLPAGLVVLIRNVAAGQ